jgi:hypothetical protein
VQGLAAADVALNFIQRWDHSIDSNSEYKHYPYLIPKPIRVVEKSQASLYGLFIYNIKFKLNLLLKFKLV